MNGVIEQRGKNSWRISVYVGMLDGKKQFRRLTMRGTKKDADRARVQLLADVMDDKPDPDGTFSRLLDQWYDLKARDFSPSTARETLRLIEKRIKPELGPIALKRLRPPEIDAFYGRLHKKGLGPGYVRRIHGIVHAALEQGVKWQIMDRNPAAATTPPTVAAGNIQPPGAPEVKQIMASLSETDPYLAAYIQLAATTGTRRGQLCGLQWADVDWEKKLLSISRAVVLGPDGIVVKDYGKTHASTRRITLGPRTFEILKALRKQTVEDALRCGVTLKPGAFLFSDADSRLIPWRPDATSRRYRKACEAVGVACRLHDLKHFAATEMLANGEPITVVAERLGTDAATILRVYAAFIPGSDQRAADKMDELLA